MATTPASKLVIGTKVSLKITSVLSRGKAFVVFLEGEETPVIIAKRNAIEDGYVHRSQLVGITADITPTQKTNGTSDGWLASVELPMAAMSTNPLLTERQRIADKYAMAGLYAAEEV